jgi:hypothetical protein
MNFISRNLLVIWNEAMFYCLEIPRNIFPEITKDKYEYLVCGPKTDYEGFQLLKRHALEAWE